MKRGTMDDISQEAGDTSRLESSAGETPVDSMSSQGAKQIYEREAQIVINYSKLDDDYKDVSCLGTIILDAIG